MLHIVQLKIISLTVEKENYFYFYDCVKKVFDCRTSVTEMLYTFGIVVFTLHLTFRFLFSLKDINILFNFSTNCYKTFTVTQLWRRDYGKKLKKNYYFDHFLRMFV